MIKFLPTNYSDTRPHHLIVLYGSYQVFAILSTNRFLAKLRDRLSNCTTILLSNFSDLCLPLLYSPVSSFFLPDALIRLAIRKRCEHTLLDLGSKGAQDDQEAKQAIVTELKTMPIAIETDAANDQHYEIPANFYDLCLGSNKKYSSGLWPFPASSLGKGKGMTFKESLDASEVAMLDLYVDRAGGIGQSHNTFKYIAAKFPNCKITSISNSHSQREYILRTASERGYNVSNINVITCDVSRWEDVEYCEKMLSGVKSNDRVFSIEMFEHMKNYAVLMSKIHDFLKPEGKLFVHIFTHLSHTYHFEKGWMADTFFTGGTMPSDDLLLYFAEHFSVARHWRVNGSNYEKTSNAWLGLMDEHWKSGKLEPILEQAYGEGKGREWYVNWRLFYLACAELFGYKKGEEWMVSHYLFDRR